MAAAPVPDPARSGAWDLALLAAACLAVDPVGLGGASLRAAPGPHRDRWLDILRRLLPDGAPLRRVPAGITDDRLLGGLDLGVTLSSGRAVSQRGVLADCDGGAAVLAMAERVPAGTAARIASVIDAGVVRVEREGFSLEAPARFAVVALDESVEEGESPPATLLDRMAFRIDLRPLRAADGDGECPWDAADVAAARARLAQLQVDAVTLEALCASALALGVDSPRAALQALRVARAAAALAGATAVGPDQARIAAALVLGPRATRVPAPPADAAPPEEETAAQDDAVEAPPPPPEPPSAEDAAPPPDDAAPPPAPPPAGPLGEQVLDAARATLPPGLLANGALDFGAGSRGGTSGRAGAMQASRRRGRPAGERRGLPGGGARLALMATLRAAAPWQRLRRGGTTPQPGMPLLRVLASDLHVQRFRDRAETTTVFILDASGSSALHRLAEAKGAVELLLAQCYVRRDRVAVVAFRGRGAELLLPPTRSLVRARRSLAGLPGGGPTPLAAGIDAGAALAAGIRGEGRTPALVVLTDGRANVTRDGIVERARAAAQALDAARRLRAAAVDVLLVDTAPRPAPAAAALAAAMGARYLPLPQADASQLAAAAQAVAPRGARR